jgi:predicted HicB family RNase H-like nuclease
MRPPRNRPGRPPLSPDGASAAIHVKMSPHLFDAACREAAQARISLPALVRSVLTAHLQPTRRPGPSDT